MHDNSIKASNNCACVCTCAALLLGVTFEFWVFNWLCIKTNKKVISTTALFVHCPKGRLRL